MKKNLWAAIALMMAAGMTACNSDNGDDAPLPNTNNERKDIALTRSEQQLVSSGNDFAFNLFRELGKAGAAGENAPETSLIVSPISITYALGMINNGAVGETQAQINKVLGFGEEGADGINVFCRKMLTEAPALDKLTKVMIANTIYMNKGYELKPDFTAKAKEFFEAEPEMRDFHDGKTMDVINQWASDHTEKMIEEVLNERSFNPAAVSYLLNAIYFKGAWAEKFNKSATRNEPFASADKPVPMMHQEHAFDYAETPDCQLLRLPYGNNAYRMTVILPREGKTVADVLPALTARTWADWQARMRSALVDVKLPRFESKNVMSLNGVMKALGMPKAFQPDVAEFPNFCNTSVHIGMMKQVARIKLNEEGTEAAAVTVIGLDTASIDPEPHRVEFHANRPFLYVISEQSTGAVFFIGKYVGD